MPRLQFALFGDSLTQRSFEVGGWGARLVNLYARKADVLQRGYSGYNTRWALQTLDENFPVAESSRRYDLVTVWLGANDAALADRSNGRQHVPIKEYTDNLNTILDRFQQLSARILVITPSPVDEPARVQYAKSFGEDAHSAERSQEQARLYADAAISVAEQRGLPSIDMHSELLQNSEWRSFLEDGLHFNAAGQEQVFEIILRHLESRYPDLRSDRMAPDFPLNMDIDHLEFHSSFTEHSQKLRKKAERSPSKQ